MGARCRVLRARRPRSGDRGAGPACGTRRSRSRWAWGSARGWRVERPVRPPGAVSSSLARPSHRSPWLVTRPVQNARPRPRTQGPPGCRLIPTISSDAPMPLRRRSGPRSESRAGTLAAPTWRPVAPRRRRPWCRHFERAASRPKAARHRTRWRPTKPHVVSERRSRAARRAGLRSSRPWRRGVRRRQRPRKPRARSRVRSVRCVRSPPTWVSMRTARPTSWRSPSWSGGAPAATRQSARTLPFGSGTS